MPKLFVDIESRSKVDLTKRGVYVYAEDDSTEITVVCWALDDGPVQRWHHQQGRPLPRDFLGLLADPSITVVAHNAGFERTMFAGKPGCRIGIKPVPLERWECTAALAACFGLPRSLEGVGVALSLPVQKDKDGHKLMLKMCKPLKPKARPRLPGETPAEYRAIKPRLLAEAEAGPTQWLEDLASLERETDYCVLDVETERLIAAQLPPMPASEREVWLLTEEMNDRGLLVDEALLVEVLFLIDDAEAQINAELRKITNGQVQRVTDHGAITRWLRGFGVDDEALADLGEDGVSKHALIQMLSRTDLPDIVRNVLQLRQDGGKSSTAKYNTMLRLMCADGRVRGSLVYAGAQATSRWAGKGIQPQNLRRADTLAKKMYAAIADLMAGATLAEMVERYGPALVIASEMLRPIFIAGPDEHLVRGDSAQIEARCLPWLAGAEDKLEVFRAYDAGTGPDQYRITAAKILGILIEAVTSAQRQAYGKVPELALGYQGGVGAFQSMAKVYRVEMTDEQADEIKVQWRAANPKIVAFWRELEDQAVACMLAPPDGTLFPVGTRGCGFKRNSKALLLRLPSGHCLVHWSPRLRQKVTPWGREYWQVVHKEQNAKTKQWWDCEAYGGKWCAKLTQATARDLMAYWLAEGRKAGLRLMLTVHDEMVGGAPKDRFPTVEDATATVVGIMKRVPSWAAGLPVSSESSAGHRYHKA